MDHVATVAITPLTDPYRDNPLLGLEFLKAGDPSNRVTLMAVSPADEMRECIGAVLTAWAETGGIQGGGGVAVVFGDPEPAWIEGDTTEWRKWLRAMPENPTVQNLTDPTDDPTQEG